MGRFPIGFWKKSNFFSSIRSQKGAEIAIFVQFVQLVGLRIYCREGSAKTCLISIQSSKISVATLHRTTSSRQGLTLARPTMPTVHYATTLKRCKVHIDASAFTILCYNYICTEILKISL